MLLTIHVDITVPLKRDSTNFVTMTAAELVPSMILFKNPERISQINSLIVKVYLGVFFQLPKKRSIRICCNDHLSSLKIRKLVLKISFKGLDALP